MRAKLFLTLSIALPALYSCSKAENTDTDKQIAEGVRYVAETYPAATLQDVYKTCYQDFFGSEHMLPDSASARRYIAYEMTQLENDTMLMPLYEATGWRHRYERISLQNVLDGTISEEDLLHRFLDASAKPQAADSCEWTIEWSKIESIALTIRSEWADSALQAELKWCADSCYAVRHSQSFRETYNPHYRIAFKKD